MPGYTESAVSAAPPEEVWKILYDPTRIPEWWVGLVQVEGIDPGRDGAAFDVFEEGAPGAALPQVLRGSRDGDRVVVSCLAKDARFDFRLSPASDGGTLVEAVVELPDERAGELAESRARIARSLVRLAALAAS